MTVNISHDLEIDHEVVIEDDFIIPQPLFEESPVRLSPPSDTPIFDQLLEDFFKDRKDTFQDLLSRRLDPRPSRQFIDDPENQFVTLGRIDASPGLDDTQPMPKLIVKPYFDLTEDDRVVQAITRPFKLEPDIQE